MIVIDTSVLAELFIVPESSVDQARRDRAQSLFRKIESNITEAILSEVAIHECYYVVVMRKKLYSADAFAALFHSLLHFPGWRMSDSELLIYVRAFDIVSAHPRLEFSDAVIAARAEAHNAELATFDQHLAAIYDGPVWSTV